MSRLDARLYREMIRTCASLGADPSHDKYDPDRSICDLEGGVYPFRVDASTLVVILGLDGATNFCDLLSWYAPVYRNHVNFCISSAQPPSTQNQEWSSTLGQKEPGLVDTLHSQATLRSTSARVQHFELCFAKRVSGRGSCRVPASCEKSFVHAHDQPLLAKVRKGP